MEDKKEDEEELGGTSRSKSLKKSNDDATVPNYCFTAVSGGHQNTSSDTMLTLSTVWAYQGGTPVEEVCCSFGIREIK